MDILGRGNKKTVKICKCRGCKCDYYEHLSSPDYKGYCSSKCLEKKTGLTEDQLKREASIRNCMTSDVVETRRI